MDEGTPKWPLGRTACPQIGALETHCLAGVCREGCTHAQGLIPLKAGDYWLEWGTLFGWNWTGPAVEHCGLAQGQ